MKVHDTKPAVASDIPRAKAGEAQASDATSRAAQASVGTAAAESPHDRVTVQAAREVDTAIESARRSTGATRAAKLEQLDAQVRSGKYAADPSRVAEQILSSALIDARLQAMFRG